MKRKVFYIGGILAVIALLGGGYLLWASLSAATSTFIKAERDDYLETVIAAGRVAGVEVVPLSFSVPGSIEEIRVEEGDQVKKGQVLAALENETERNRISQQENAVMRAQSQLNRLQTTDYTQAQERLKQAEAQEQVARLAFEYAEENQDVQPGEMLRQAEVQLDSAREQYERSQTNYERHRDLYEREAISLRELEEAENMLTEAEKNLELAESSLAIAKSDYEGRHLDLEQARSELEAAQADVAQAHSSLEDLGGEALRLAQLEKERAQILLEEAELAYEKTYLKAPQDGQINRLRVSAGAQAQVGQEAMKFIPEGEVSYVEVQVDEDFTGRVVPGQEAVITTNAFPGEEYRASVQRVSPGIDEDRGTFKVRLALDELVEEFVTDLAVFAEIIIDERENSIVLEQRTLFREDGEHYVFTERNGLVHRQAVEAVEIGSGFALIESGLEPGDIVLTSPDLSEGQQVELAGEGE